MIKDTSNNLDFLKFLKENISLILLALYFLSFTNYYVYYKSFEIPIFNYIGLNDMIFFALEYIFKIAFIIFLCEIIFFIFFSFLFGVYQHFILFFIKNKFLFYLNTTKDNRERLRNVILNKHFSSSLTNLKFLMLFLSIFFISGSDNLLLFFPTLIIYFIYYIEKISKMESLSFSLIVISLIIYISFFVATLYNSYSKRFEKDKTLISFIENSEYITTDRNISCYNYLGETSSHIFLYDIENKNSKIYDKGNLSEITIKNSNDLDNYILRIKQNKVFKHIVETFKEK